MRKSEAAEMAAAEAFHVPRSSIKARSNRAPYVAARHCAYLLLREDKMSLQRIADALDRQDHTTIMHGVRKARYLEQRDREYREAMAQAREAYKAATLPRFIRAQNKGFRSARK